MNQAEKLQASIVIKELIAKVAQNLKAKEAHFAFKKTQKLITLKNL